MLLQATNEHVQRIAEIEMAVFPENCFNEHTLANELDLGTGWVIEEAGEIIAYVLVRIEDCLTDVTRLGVLPRHQGKGCGKQLLTKAFSLAPKIMLTVRKDNHRAIGLYRKFGFEIVGHLKDENSWVMITSSGS